MATPDEVRSTFENEGYEVLNVERNRSQYRVFLAEDSVERSAVDSLLTDAYGEESVFGTSVADESAEGVEGTVRVVTFRLR